MKKLCQVYIPSVGRVTKASRTLKRAKGVFNNAQKIASLARQTSKAHEKRPCGKRGNLLGVVESAGGMNTPLALFGVREAFVTLPTEGRLGITFSSPSDSIVALSQYRSFSHFDNSRCMGGVTYIRTRAS